MTSTAIYVIQMKFVQRHLAVQLLNAVFLIFDSIKTSNTSMRFFRIQILSYVASIEILLEKQKAFFLSFLNVIQLLEKKYHLYEFFGEHSRLLTL